jgi:hypothetical protein
MMGGEPLTAEEKGIRNGLWILSAAVLPGKSDDLRALWVEESAYIILAEMDEVAPLPKIDPDGPPAHYRTPLCTTYDAGPLCQCAAGAAHALRGLDVERLRKAWLAHDAEFDEEDHGHDCVKAIAAKYALLPPVTVLTRATAKGTTIDVDEWGRPLYVIGGVG